MWKLDFQVKGEVDREGDDQEGGGGHPFLTQEPDPKRDKPDREEDETTGEEEDSKTDELNDDNSLLKALRNTERNAIPVANRQRKVSKLPVQGLKMLAWGAGGLHNLCSVVDAGCVSQIPDPDIIPYRIPVLDFGIPDLTTATKEERGKYLLSHFFSSHKYQKIGNYFIFDR